MKYSRKALNHLTIISSVKIQGVLPVALCQAGIEGSGSATIFTYRARRFCGREENVNI